jgi:NAD(P)-dependent dehydrogenase (short-subunit alcohol dehydrogenase family)
MTKPQDLVGQTIIITGAGSGIGAAAARELTSRGARAILAVRDEGKGRRAAATMESVVQVRPLDLASLSSIRRFAATVDEPVDVLINNAGAMTATRKETEDGFESQLGVNHLGHFALTNLLLPLVRRRVVTISSSAHSSASIDFSDLQWEQRSYSPFGAYGQSKLANLLFSAELQRLLNDVGSPVRSTAAHPGWASTGFTITTGNRLLDLASKVGTRLLAHGPESGARPTIMAAVDDVPGGSFVGPSRLGGVRGPARVTQPARNALDAQVAKRLWEASERLTATRFPLG